jgi:hypothetical protein
MVSLVEMKSVQHIKSLEVENKFQILSSYHKENNEIILGSKSGDISSLLLNTFEKKKIISKKISLSQIVTHEKYIICVGDSLTLLEGNDVIACVENIMGTQITIFENSWVLLVNKFCEIRKFHLSHFLIFKNNLKFKELDLYSSNVRILGEKWVLVDRLCDLGVLEFPSLKEVLNLQRESSYCSTFEVNNSILFISFDKNLKGIKIPSGKVLNSFTFNTRVVFILSLKDYLVVVTKMRIYLLNYSLEIILNEFFHNNNMHPIHNVMLSREYLIIHSSRIHFYKILESNLIISDRFQDLFFKFK